MGGGFEEKHLKIRQDLPGGLGWQWTRTKGVTSEGRFETEKE